MEKKRIVGKARADKEAQTSRGICSKFLFVKGKDAMDHLGTGTSTND